jgi:hypothetical protein
MAAETRDPEASVTDIGRSRWNMKRLS